MRTQSEYGGRRAADGVELPDPRPPSPVPRPPSPDPRRHGVLLLIVLALLAMFGVLAIAFVILTGQTRRGAEALRKVGQYDDQWEKTANQAALDLFRGSNNHQSPFQAHNFLENLYGNEWFTGSMTTASPVIGVAPQGQLIQFAFTQTYPPQPTSNPATNPTLFLPEQHLARVLTMLNGPAAGYSTHIVGMVGTTQLQVAAFEGLNSSDVIGFINSPPANVVPACLINGMPYSGTGFGFNPSSVTQKQTPPPQSYDTAADGNGWPFALLPNHAAFSYTNADGTNSYSATYVNWLGQPDPAGPGGATRTTRPPTTRTCSWLCDWHSPRATLAR